MSSFASASRAATASFAQVRHYRANQWLASAALFHQPILKSVHDFRAIRTGQLRQRFERPVFYRGPFLDAALDEQRP